MKKAENLKDMLKVFRLGPLNSNELLDNFFYDGTIPVRTGYDDKSPLLDIYEECTSGLVSTHLLVSHTGCGKSTELHNLRRRLEAEGWPVHIVNSEQDLDLFNVTRWDILLLVAEAMCKIAKDREINIDSQLLKEVVDYIKTDTTTTTETSDEANMELGAVVNFFVSIKAAIKSSEKQKKTVEEKLEKRASDWIRLVEEISHIITNHVGMKFPIVIFEGLDKANDLEKIIDIFQYTVLAKLPFPIIYTFPVSLVYDTRMTLIEASFSVHHLPMIRVNNIDNTPHQEGIKVMKAIIEKRASLDLFEENVLEELIIKTGGVIRQLFMVIISAAKFADRRAEGTIQMNDATRALADLKDTLKGRIVMDEFEELSRIYTDVKYKFAIKDKESLIKFMRGLIVLEYKNGGKWHNLHPLVAEFLRDIRELEKDEAKSNGA